MRFLRLDFRDDLHGLDLHPLISVVSATESNESEQLLEAVRRLSVGSTAGLRGLVEHDGLLVELDADGGEPLSDLTTSATVVIHVDPVTQGTDDTGLHREIARWERQAAIDSASVEEIRAHLDLSVKARTTRLQARLAPPKPTPANAALTAGRLRLRAVRRAFDAVGQLQEFIPEPAPEIESLIERWEAHRRRRAEHETHISGLASSVADAERAVTAATDALAAAREDSRTVLLDPEREARLEALYDLSNESSLFRKGLNREEEAEMQALLGSVGVSSWTEYSVLRMSPTVPPDKLAAVQRAEDDLERARQRLERTRSERATDEVARSLHEELAAIKTDCQPHLGVLVPADIGGALRQRLQMIENPHWLEALNDLRDVLSSNDLHPPGGFEPAEILGWTDSWLRAQESLHQPDRATMAADADDEARLRIELDTEALSLIRHERALGQIDRAERNAVRSGLRVRHLRGQLRALAGHTGPTTAGEVMAMIEPVAEQVLADIGGSVPLAVVGDLSGLPPAEVDELMDALEAVAQKVQVVLVSDNPAAADWARRVGLERADLRLGATSFF
ncbi:MAG: hypothetical protein AAGA93_02350 [Actinomycetota bacterium]